MDLTALKFLALDDPLDEALDNEDEPEYTVEEITDCAHVVFANTVRTLRGECISDNALNDASRLFLCVLRLYLPTYRKDYDDLSDAYNDNTHP